MKGQKMGYKVDENNPWIEQHIVAEMDYQWHLGRRGARAMAEKLVRLEFAGAPDPIDCECGEKAWYRATVGAMICPSCRALYRCNGERLR